MLHSSLSLQCSSITLPDLWSNKLLYFFSHYYYYYFKIFQYILGGMTPFEAFSPYTWYFFHEKSKCSKDSSCLCSPQNTQLESFNWIILNLLILLFVSNFPCKTNQRKCSTLRGAISFHILVNGHSLFIESNFHIILLK